MIIKIGGGATIHVKGILEDVTTLDESVILVHGANAQRDDLARRLGSPTKNVTSVSGYESVLTDEGALDMLLMAYCGLRNKRIVEMAHQVGLNAMGLSGIDGGLIRGKRNPGIRIEENGKQKILRDFSGKPSQVNVELLHLLLDHGYTPVLTVPILDETNTAVNTQNDSIIRCLIEALGPSVYLDLFEAPGLLRDRHDESTLIPRLSPEDLALEESRVEGRMKRKVQDTRKAFLVGAKKVIYADGRVEHPVLDALSGHGTVIE